jgi:hypothetical protein
VAALEQHVARRVDDPPSRRLAAHGAAIGARHTGLA